MSIRDRAKLRVPGCHDVGFNDIVLVLIDPCSAGLQVLDKRFVVNAPLVRSRAT